MSDAIKVVYLGPADEYENIASQVVMPRGLPVPVDEKAAKWLLIKREGQPREIFREGDPAIAKLKPALDEAYRRYPDLVIKHYRKEAAKWQQIADSVHHEDPQKMAGMRAGALSEVRNAERVQYKHMVMKAERQGLPEPAPFEEIFANEDDELESLEAGGGDDDFADLDKPKARGRGRKAVAV